MLEWNGERYLPYIDPSICGAEIHYEHLHRYAFASQFVKGKKVLDLASGEGYGTFILSKEAQSVTGIEIDPVAVSHAFNTYNKENIEFKEGSILNIPIKGEKVFDIIVCFEAIEHVKEHEILLSEISRLLKDDGLLIISTPNKKIYSEDSNYHNPFHEKELYFGELKELLKTHFAYVYFFGQRIITGSAIFSIPLKEFQTCTEFVIGKSDDKFSFKKCDEKIPVYFVALASNSRLDDSIITKSYLIDASNTEISLFSEQVANLNSTLSVKDRQIQEVSTQVAHLNQTLVAKDLQIQEVSTQVAHLNQTLVAKDLQIQEISTQVAHLNQTLVAKDLQIQEISTQVAHLNQTLVAKDQEINIQYEQVWALEEENTSLKRSISFCIFSKFHRVFIEPLFPQNSRRRKWYDLGLKGGRIFANDGFSKTYMEFKNYLHMKRSLKKLKVSDTHNKDLKFPYTNLEITKEESVNILITKLESFLSHSQNRLIFPKYEKPVVSIIILTFNKAAYTYQCLESLIDYTDIPYEVILVDNGSTDTTHALLRQTENIVQILNENNLGFIQGCNQGAIPAKGKYLLFLNNDTVVTKNWISGLVDIAENDQACGAVGCKLVWPNGQLQEAGSIIWRDGSVTGYGRGDDPLKPEYAYLREIDFCSGACLLVRTDLFEILQGFDERYIPAYYEDADLCLGIQNLGYKVIYQPKVTIFHHEFTSSSKDHATNFMKNNQLKFREKWEDYLKTKEFFSPESILNSRDLRNGKKILVIDDRIPASNQGSGYPRANILLRYLGELGYKVTFFPLADTTPWQPFTSQFQDQGIEVFYGDSLNFEKFSQTRSNFYDTVIVSRPHNFERSFQIIKSYFPDAYLIYDAEALFSTREILKAAVEGVILDDKQIRTLREKEFKLMRNANLIVTVSEIEREIIQKDGGFDNCVVFGYPVQIQDQIPEFKARKDILFVGSFLSPNGPNDDAILYFVKETWPEVQKRLKCKLFVVGINPPDQIQKLASSSVIITGFVPNLDKCYNNCRIFIVPHRYAAGIPLKLIEAMSFGIPAVVSDLIASQLNLQDGKEVLIARDSEQFVENIVKLYQNEELWRRVQQNSCVFLRGNFDTEKNKKILQTIIEVKSPL